MDPVQSMFSGDNNVPTHDQIDSLIRLITRWAILIFHNLSFFLNSEIIHFSELSISLVEENLSEQIARNAIKSIKMFAVKTEQQLETGSDAAQVIGMYQLGNILSIKSIYLGTVWILSLVM